jgi:hypothetical protein
VLADERGVLRRLVGGKMRHETTIAEGGGVAIHDEHASPGSRQGDHLPKASFGSDVAAQ